MLEVLSAKARMRTAKVGLMEIFRTVDLSGENAAADGTVSHQPNTQLADFGKYPFFDTAFPKRVFGLNCRERMHRVGTAYGSGSDFGEANVADLAGTNQIGKRADRLFDSSVRIQPVLVIEINVFRI